MIASFVRGLSTRDVENTRAEALGSDAALSKSTVFNICQAIRGEYDAWWMRDLTGVTLDYLFIDASHFRMHPNAPAEPVLAVWGIDTDGKPVFIGLEAAAFESHDAWVNFSAGLLDRGLEPPLLIISDGGKGLISACELVLGRTLRQWCLIHKCRNVVSKVSLHDQEQVKKEFWEIFDTAAIGLAPASCSSTPSSAASATSRRSGRRPTRPRPIPFWPTGIHSPLTCGVPPSTTSASGTPTLSSGPSARPAAASRSSAASPARPAASPSPSPSCPGLPPAGAASPPPPPPSVNSNACDATCSTPPRQK
ncbi:transposase [Streptomyces sp. NBC_00400]